MLRSVVAIALGVLYADFVLAGQIPSLAKYEAIYELFYGDYPECTSREFIAVRRDDSVGQNAGLIVVPLDRQMSDRGWEWLRFTPLDGKRRIATSDFGLVQYERFTYKNVQWGLELRHEVKSCQLRFFCGPWKLQTTLLLRNSSAQIGLRNGFAACDYRSIGFSGQR
jgi:hypothetical protein